MSVFDSLSDAAHAAHVRRLSQRSSSYLQTIIAAFTLARQKDGIQLQLNIANDPLTVIDGRGKRELEALCRASGAQCREQLQRDLDDFRANPKLMGYRFDCSDWPLRYANGGVLPVAHLEGRDYFLLFYRDIFPIGWNIANGASDDADEWLAPDQIIHREFAEEILIADPSQRLLYVYSPPLKGGAFDLHRTALTAWTPHRPELAEYKQVPMPFKWIMGPDAVRIEHRERTVEQSGFFLSITPDDHGIEVDRFVLIRLPGDARLFSGEIANGRPFNHIVGLFDVERLRSIYAGNEFKPDIFYFNGDRFDGDRFDKVLPKYLKHVRTKGADGLAPLHNSEQVQFYKNSEVHFDFCPITRALIGRYFQWRDATDGVEPLTPAVHSTPVDHNQRHDVFISHVSAHTDSARLLYDHLRKRHGDHPVFLSAQTLKQQGESNYRQSIERALESARCLVVFMLAPEDLQSGWVNYEWSAFHSEIISGRKPDGQIFTLLDHERMKIDRLPLGLRQREVIQFDRTAPHEAFDRLSGFLTSALG